MWHDKIRSDFIVRTTKFLEKIDNILTRKNNVGRCDEFNTATIRKFLHQQGIYFQTTKLNSHMGNTGIETDFGTVANPNARTKQNRR